MKAWANAKVEWLEEKEGWNGVRDQTLHIKSNRR